MSERLRELEREESTAPAEPQQTSRSGLRARLSPGRVFSPKAFLVALALSTVGIFLAGSLPIPLSGLLGVFAAAFLLGLLGQRGYLETAAAGAGAAGVTVLLDFFVVSLLGGFGVPLALFGAGGGALAALLGYYFGTDLRAGLTREL
ncbi:hypothetical protein [Natronomonas sp. EA1]|uniref:hypothetical protein n=1 Tax=Natronomonas sp. EA1 TaxID=3421655 RepID=UPI003EB8A0AA